MGRLSITYGMAGAWLFFIGATTKIETLMITVCWTEFHIKITLNIESSVSKL